MLEILGKTNIDFMGKRHLAFIFSGILTVLGVIAVVQIARGAANLGIDFAGGTAVQLKFDRPIRIDEARKALEANGLANVELQEFVEEKKILVRVKATTTIEEKIADRIVAVFAKEFPDNKFIVDSSTEDRPDHREKAAAGCADRNRHFLRRHYFLHRRQVRIPIRDRGRHRDLSRRVGCVRRLLYS